MARLLVVLAVLAVVGWQAVAGQGDRNPVNFQPPAASAAPVAPAAPAGGVGGPIAFAPPGRRCVAGFTVRKASPSTLTANTRLRFQDVLISMGGWSPSLSDFEAPCSGIYYFSFHAVSPERRDFTLQLMRNGQFQVTAYGSRGDFQQASNSALLALNQGDIVHLQLEQGQIYEHPGGEAYTSFSGYLVYEF